jgi:hypothetical protein
MGLTSGKSLTVDVPRAHFKNFEGLQRDKVKNKPKDKNVSKGEFNKYLKNMVPVPIFCWPSAVMAAGSRFSNTNIHSNLKQK